MATDEQHPRPAENKRKEKSTDIKKIEEKFSSRRLEMMEAENEGKV